MGGVRHQAPPLPLLLWGVPVLKLVLQLCTMHRCNKGSMMWSCVEVKMQSCDVTVSSQSARLTGWEPFRCKWPQRDWVEFLSWYSLHIPTYMLSRIFFSRPLKEFYSPLPPCEELRAAPAVALTRYNGRRGRHMALSSLSLSSSLCLCLCNPLWPADSADHIQRGHRGAGDECRAVFRSIRIGQQCHRIGQQWPGL